MIGKLPPHSPGLRIGLLGGSFNPAHAAHRAISLFAMKRLGLDRVWWLVSPGNPLKDEQALRPLAERLARAHTVARHPRIDVSDVEAQLGTRYSIDALRYILPHCPGVRFVWLMGADSLQDFHLWKAWRTIFGLLPIAVVDRGGAPLRALSSPAAQSFRTARLPAAEAKRLPHLRPPAWVFLHGLKSPLSSTALRQAATAGGG